MSQCANVGPLPTDTPLSERVYLWIEYIALFWVLPALFCFRTVHVRLPILLISAAAVCLSILLTDSTFDRRQLWNPLAMFRGLPATLGLWLIGVLVLSMAVKVAAPDLWLAFPREHPGLWFAVIILYPLISVYPQNIVYRVFIFHRYERLFGSRAGIIWASACAFAFGHVIFQNWLALGLTLAGGLIFAHTYARYRSALLASIEHALYGCLVFTVGMGQSLYLAAVNHAR